MHDVPESKAIISSRVRAKDDALSQAQAAGSANAANNPHQLWKDHSGMFKLRLLIPNNVSRASDLVNEEP